MFTNEEIKAAKAVREQIKNGEFPDEIKSVYMAGEIAMWDEMQQSQPPSTHQPEVKVLLEALEKIINPIDFLRKEAEAEGCTLDGRMAIQLANDPVWLREIADQALTTYKESKPSE